MCNLQFTILNNKEFSLLKHTTKLYKILQFMTHAIRKLKLERV